MWSREWELEDTCITSEELTLREVANALKGASKNLDFTYERPGDFNYGWIPTFFLNWGSDRGQQVHPQLF